MPCQAGPTERDNLTAAQVELDRLTRENDWLRELTIRLVNGESVTKQELARVRRDQTEHRKEDLVRLEKKFRASIADQKAMGREGVATLTHGFLGLVVTADPSRPLEPQLGFDPDSV